MFKHCCIGTTPSWSPAQAGVVHVDVRLGDRCSLPCKRKLELLETEIGGIDHVPEVTVQRAVHPPTDDAVRAAGESRVLEVLFHEVPLSRHNRRCGYVGLPDSTIPIAVAVRRP